MFSLTSLRRPTTTRTNARRRSNQYRPMVDSLEVREVLSTIHISVPINAQVHSYAASHFGQQVGNGQCAVLAQNAVASANGVPFSSLGATGSNSDYVWGNLVSVLNGHAAATSAIQPGDIIQFRNVSTTDTATYVDSKGHSTTYTSTQVYPHHTAVVDFVSSGEIFLLEQNVNNSLKVQSGEVWGSSTTTHSSGGGLQITVTHTFNGGTMWVYQPYETISIQVPSVPKI